jgi:hypothetical protein
MNLLLSSQDTGKDWASWPKGWVIGSACLAHGLSYLTFWDIRSEYFRNFVDSCLQKIPQDRPTSEVLLKVSTFSVVELVAGRAVENYHDSQFFIQEAFFIYFALGPDGSFPLSC